MIRHVLTGGVLIAALATPALATETATLYRLTPQQTEDALRSAVPSSPAALPFDTAAGVGPGIHGEIGVGIGTGGARETFGTAAVPLGGDGYAALSFDIGRAAYSRWRRDR